MANVKLKSLTKKFGSTVAVDKIDLEIEDGSFVTFVGPSGCGKTTTLRLIAGFIKPDGGDVLIDNKPQKGIPPNKRPTSIVFQDYAIFPHMTVFENISYGLKTRKMDKSTIKKKTEEILEMMGMKGYGDRYANQLSGGQQQRVALARSMVLKPKVLLMDEPISNLDAKLRESVSRELKNLQKKVGITTIYVTHDQAEALSMSDKIAVMNQGSFEQYGSPKDVYCFPETRFVADFIGDANYLDGRISDIDQNNIEIEVANENSLFTNKDNINLIKNQNNKNEQLKIKQDVKIMIRPEAISISKDSKYNLNGKIIDNMFYGDEIWYWIEIDNERLIVKEKTHPEKEILSGDVFLNISADWINIFIK